MIEQIIMAACLRINISYKLVKMKKILFTFLFISALINISCSNDDDEQRNGATAEQASITVRIQGRPIARNIGESSSNQAFENLVSNLTVFVFNYVTGDLEKAESFTLAEGDYTRQVTGLSTGTEKRIVAFVNVPTGLDLSTISTYSQLNTNLITLDSQNSTDIATRGLFMSGESTSAITLSTTGDNTVTIPVSRRVAKVVLKSLIINPETASNLSLFTLSGVSIQKARLTGTPTGDLVPPTGDATVNYAGGIASPTGATPNFSRIRGFLLEPLALPDGYTINTEIITPESEERYFYILPNNGLNGNATMLTISGTYGTTPENAYYPIRINSTAGQGSTDGNFVESNKIYEISIVIRQPNLFSEDPNEVPTDVALDVTITPQDWETTIEQTVEW